MFTERRSEHSPDGPAVASQAIPAAGAQRSAGSGNDEPDWAELNRETASTRAPHGPTRTRPDHIIEPRPSRTTWTCQHSR